MALIINLIAALILFWIPIKKYQNRDYIAAPHPFKPDTFISVNFELYFLVYSVLTAMVFLGPLSLVKYGFWIIFLLILAFRRLEIKIGVIVGTYLLFLAWAVFSTLWFSSVKFEALMMLIKYSLPLFYMWLGYTAIKDSDDLLFFMKKVAIGMCVYALIIGGFSAKVLSPLYVFLNFSSGGLFISYGSLADYFSGLIVIPIGLYIITGKNKWLYAIGWIVLSTILEIVRTGLGGIFFASSFFLLCVYRAKSIPLVVGICFVAMIVVFMVPSVRQKMFIDEDVAMSTFSASDADFEHIESNAREAIWEMNMQKFYEPHKLTGSGLGESTAWMKSNPDRKSRQNLTLIHSDYVQILCDLGLIGIVLFGLFVIVILLEIMLTAWSSGAPFVLKLTSGMALGSCAGTFFSMGFDNVVAYAQQSFVLPFIMIGIYLKVKDLYNNEQWV